MLTIPLIRTEEMNLTPIERSAMRCEQVITAMMMQATIADLNTCAMYGDGTEIGAQIERMETLIVKLESEVNNA
jgi:hypothetical protein